MKGITIKLPESTLRRLQQQAGAAGRSVASLVRERVERGQTGGQDRHDGSVYAVTADLAGSLDGPRRAATNTRRKFRRA